MRILLLCLIGFMSGVVIAGGIFAFIIIIGIVPRLIQKTKTASHIFLYESVISAGGIGGSLVMLAEGSLNISPWWETGIGLLYGIFVGCLAISIAEILDVMPILGRRLRMGKALPWIMIVLALGKTVGTLIQFFVPGLIPAK